MDEREYLQPDVQDFDPASYKIPQLRNVLLQNDISYAGNAKKKDLVELFNQHIKPNAEQRLKELDGVIANDDRIVYVEKKSKKSNDTTVDEEDSTLQVEKTRKKTSKKSQEEGENKDIKKSPRKSSKSNKKDSETDAKKDEVTESVQASPRKSRAAARNVSADLGKIPDLKKSPPPARERSPRRKASAKAKTEEDDEVKRRERSPRRKVSNKTEKDELKANDDSKSRERSPRRKVSEKKDAEVKEEPKSKKRESKRKTHVKDEEPDSADDIQQVTEREFEEAKSPFKFGTKFESSFSNDNVFQSPGHSSPDQPKKVIPRKRASENATKSPRKSTRTIRKTAFSSSPEPVQNVKSPAKKALEISKFEASSPPSKFVKNEFASNDIFDLEEAPQHSFNFDNVTEKSPTSVKKSKSPAALKNSKTKSPTSVKNENEKFETPNEGNASKISNLSSAASTPSKSEVKRKSLLPDFSKFKVSKEFAKSLGITLQGEPETKEDEKPEDPELLGAASDDEDQVETETSINDSSVLRDLQEEIENANTAVQNEVAEAIKQVNGAFGDEETEIDATVDDERSTSSIFSIFKFSAIFGFLKQLFVFFFFVFIVIFALWYREQRILIGYCGSEIDQPTFPNTQNEYLLKFDDILQTLKPQCLEAPEHAVTLPKLKIKCRPDYVVYEPWYKIHGFLPFSDYCVKDEEKENIIKEVVSKSLELLRTKNANTKCGDGDDFEVGISDEELYNFFFESKSLRSARDHDREPAENDIPSDEDEEETYLPKEQTIFRSTSNVKLSIKCKFKKEIYENFERNKKLFIGTFFILTTFLILYRKFVSYQRRQSKIREISDIIIIKLQKQQKNSINDSTGLTNRYLSNIQLRDELLSNLRNSEKYAVWDSILNSLEKNSNIRGSTREIHGEIVKVLEWIGE